MTISLDGTTGISASGNITGNNIITTSSFTPASISTAGNITGSYIFGNGSLLTGIITSVANINSGTSNVTVVSSGGNITVGVGGTSNVAVFATTGEYVTGVISASGNITGGNISATNHTGTTVSVSGTVTGASVVGGVMTGTSVSVSGNVTGGNVLTSGLISSTGNITGGNVSGTNLTGTLATAAQTNITSVGTLSSLSVSGNVQGGNLRTAGLISATGNITAGNISATNHTGTTVSVSGNITAGNLTVSTGTITVGNIVNSNGNGVGNIGSSTTYFNTVFAKATSAQYADLAEMYVADQQYTPGIVLEFGGANEVTASTQTHSTRVAGIVSTNPSYLMNATQTGINVVAVALVGRVPCQVVGTINKGDRLVASDLPGVATVLDPALYQPACIIGKALESYNSSTVGTIEVAVGRT